MPKPLKIAHIASEVEPFTKSGGLANVIGSLPRALRDIGHEPIIITPYYKKVVNLQDQELELIAENISIEMTEGQWQDVAYYKGTLPDSDIPVYFIANEKHFSERDYLYGAINENARFFFFNVAALDLLRRINWAPDILHCHDWHTGLIPYFIKGRYKKDEFWHKTSTLFTIHNLAFQLGHNWWEVPEADRDDGRSQLPSYDNIDKIEKVNFAKRAIINADAINAVSETYRDEILTKDFGQELHRILKNREKAVFGIVNGIDFNEFNPLTDPGLVTHYSDKSANRKKDNKLWLQKYYKLAQSEDTPLLCMTSRVTEQKGFSLVTQILPTLMRLNVQMIIMGDGTKEIVADLEKISKEFPKQFVYIPFDQDRETSLYAGSDIFVLPSRFEPCGINQMIALRYGSIPVVHHIGGLADTIVDFDPGKNRGNGFTFDRYDAGHLLIVIVRALETYRHTDVWKELVVRSLQEANSWKIPAEKYVDLYKATIRIKKKADKTNGK